MPLPVYRIFDRFSSTVEKIERAIREYGARNHFWPEKIEWQATQTIFTALPKPPLDAISRTFINKKFAQYRNKIRREDYGEVLIDSRHLIEAVFKAVIGHIDQGEDSNDDDIHKLWSQTKDALEAELDKTAPSETVQQIISWADASIKVIAGRGRPAADLHAVEVETLKRRVTFIVSLSSALANFLFDTLLLEI